MGTSALAQRPWKECTTHVVGNGAITADLPTTRLPLTHRPAQLAAGKIVQAEMPSFLQFSRVIWSSKQDHRSGPRASTNSHDDYQGVGDDQQELGDD